MCEEAPLKDYLIHRTYLLLSCAVVGNIAQSPATAVSSLGCVINNTPERK